jgi:hypothetical protein
LGVKVFRDPLAKKFLQWSIIAFTQSAKRVHFTGPPQEVECADDHEAIATAMQMNCLDMEICTARCLPRGGGDLNAGRMACGGPRIDRADLNQLQCPVP